MFVVNTLAISYVHAARMNPGVERLAAGIAAYGNGKYDDAIFKLEMAKIQISGVDKESLWSVHFYSGLSYYLTGDNEEAMKEFSVAQGIIKNKSPDEHIYSPKVVKLFKETMGPSGSDIEMVFVKGGCYEMGDLFGDGGKDEKPVHKVCLDDFYIGKYEVKVGEYMEFVEETGGNKAEWQEKGNKNNINTGSDNHYNKIGSALTSDDHPIVGVSWKNAVVYAKWLSAKTGKNYRLPTEAEWEYAARSGGKKEKYAGTSSNTEFDSYTWYYKNSNGTTHSVGQKKPNGLGLYDMSGNVWEWCQNIYEDDAYSKHQHNNLINVRSDYYRVIRGGSWFNPQGRVRASDRGYFTPDFRRSYLGFRLARTVD
jgi:formylglycine-generating enzyme